MGGARSGLPLGTLWRGDTRGLHTGLRPHLALLEAVAREMCFPWPPTHHADSGTGLLFSGPLLGDGTVKRNGIWGVWGCSLLRETKQGMSWYRGRWGSAWRSWPGLALRPASPPHPGPQAPSALSAHASWPPGEEAVGLQAETAFHQPGCAELRPRAQGQGAEEPPAAGEQ